jgi:hypothetical protein
MKLSEVEDLEDFFQIDNGAANNIRALFGGGLHPDDFESVKKWELQCYNELPYDDKFMCALNELIGGFGVEPIRLEGSWDSYYGDVVAEYINTGDTYSATIVHDIREDEYEFTTWGDWYEKHIMPLQEPWHSDEFWKSLQEMQNDMVDWNDTFLIPLVELYEIMPHVVEPMSYLIEYIKEAAEDRGIEICSWIYKDEHGRIDERKSWIFIK